MNCTSVLMTNIPFLVIDVLVCAPCSPGVHRRRALRPPEAGGGQGQPRAADGAGALQPLPHRGHGSAVGVPLHQALPQQAEAGDGDLEGHVPGKYQQ